MHAGICFPRDGSGVYQLEFLIANNGHQLYSLRWKKYFVPRAWAQSASSDSPLTQRPREARPCRKPAIAWELQPPCLEPPLWAQTRHSAAVLVPCLHPQESTPWPRASGVSLRSLPARWERGCHWGGGSVPCWTQLCLQVEKRGEGRPEQHYLSPYLSPDSQRNHDPATSARKDYESLP